MTIESLTPFSLPSVLFSPPLPELQAAITAIMETNNKPTIKFLTFLRIFISPFSRYTLHLLPRAHLLNYKNPNLIPHWRFFLKPLLLFPFVTLLTLLPPQLDLVQLLLLHRRRPLQHRRDLLLYRHILHYY